MAKTTSSQSGSSYSRERSKGTTTTKSVSSNKYKWNKGAKKQMIAAENAVNNFGNFNSPYKNQLNSTINAINNSKFSYDVNKDAIYNQYREQFTNAGLGAMQEAQADATALTGGFANSYAQAAGQNAFNSYMQQLANVIPQLYSQQRTNYDADLANQYNKANLYAGLNQQAYQEWADRRNQKVADRDYYANKAWNLYNASAKTVSKEKSKTTSKGGSKQRSSSRSSSRSSKK